MQLPFDRPWSSRRRKAIIWTTRLCSSTLVFGQTVSIIACLDTSSPCRSTRTQSTSRAREPRTIGNPTTGLVQAKQAAGTTVEQETTEQKRGGGLDAHSSPPEDKGLPITLPCVDNRISRIAVASADSPYLRLETNLQHLTTLWRGRVAPGMSLASCVMHTKLRLSL